MLVSKAVANFEEQAGLSYGDVVHRPVPPDFEVNDYSKTSDVTIQDVTTSDQSMTIDRTKEVSWYLDRIDTKQSKYDLEDETMKRAMYRIKNEMDGRFLKEVANATYDCDDGDIGGTPGNGIALTPTNCQKAVSTAKAILRSADVEDDKEWFIVTSPDVTSVIEQTMVSGGFSEADKTLVNGYKGKWSGLRVYESTNVRHTFTITFGGNTLTATTFTIAGVTFSFAASPTNAGDVDIGGDAATSASNLAAAINGGSGAGTAYIAISAANRKTLKNNYVVATVNSNVVTIEAAGKQVFAKAGTNAADLTLSSQICNSIIGQMGCIDMVIQLNPEVQRNKAEKRNGYYYIVNDLYGVKTFDEGADRMLNFKTIAA